MEPEEKMDYENFRRQMITKGFLYFPQEYADSAYALQLQEENGACLIRTVDERPWLTEKPSLALYTVYEKCHGRFDSMALRDIFLEYVQRYQAAEAAEKKEQEQMAGLLGKLPEKNIFPFLLPQTGDVSGRFPGRIRGNCYCMYGLKLDGKSENGCLEIVTVTEAMMKKWNIREEGVFEMAVDNIQRLFPYTIEEVSVSEKENAYMISNTDKFLGLCNLLCAEGPLKELGLVFGSDFYVLPLSVHEAAAFSAEGALTETELQALGGGISPFCGEVWYYNQRLNTVAFTREERDALQAMLREGIPDAAERRENAAFR